MDSEPRGGVQVSEEITHAVLIMEAKRWLWRDGCSVVITDMTHQGRETPDAIGWKGRFSTLIECKVSRADFLADAKKPFRRMPETGMGMMRWFCALRGVIRESDLPPRWGLMEWHRGKMWIVRKSEPQRHEVGAREEIQLLLSAVRRLGDQSPRGVNVKFYTICNDDLSTCRATLGMAPEITSKQE